MTDLADVLARQAATVRPTADLDDVRRRARRHRRRNRNGRAAAVVVVFALVGVVAQVARSASGSRTLAIPPEVDIDTVGALVLTGPGADGGPPHGYVERVDSFALDGPTSIVLRPSGGRLGDASVVITTGAEPVVPTPDSRAADVSTLTTILDGPLGSITLRAVGVPRKDLDGIAGGTRLVAGRAAVRLPRRLAGYAIVSAATSRPPVVREARYGCDDLGEPSLGGLCFTGLATATGFEDALYATGFVAGPTVAGHPTVFSRVLLASAVLAWEPQPGVIAFIGYSGPGDPADAAPALARLAERSRIISSAEWRASDPQRGDQTNSWR